MTSINEHANNNNNNNNNKWFYSNNHGNNNTLTTTSTTTMIPSDITSPSSQSKLPMSYNESTVSTNTSTINSTMSTTSTTATQSPALGLELYSDDEQLSSSTSSSPTATAYHYNPPFNGTRTASVAPPGSYSSGGEAAPTATDPNHTSRFIQSGYTANNGSSDIRFHDDVGYVNVTTSGATSGDHVSSASTSTLILWDSDFTQEDYSVSTTASTPIAADTTPAITVDYRHTGLGGTQGISTDIHHDQQGALPQQEEDYPSSSSSMGNKHPLLQLVNTSAQSHLLDQRPPAQQATSGYNIYYKILDDPLLPHEGAPPDVRSLEHLCNGTISGSGTSGTILSILTLDSNEENGYLYNITDHVINCTNYSSAISSEEEYDYKNPLLGVLLATFAMITICGNILVMIAVARERYLRTVTNYFIVSLAIADLIIGEYAFSFLLFLFFNITGNDRKLSVNVVAFW